MAQHNTIARVATAAGAAQEVSGSIQQQMRGTDCATIVATVNRRFRHFVRGGDRVAPRVRAAASACLVASGLLISGVGGAIALAEPGPGQGEDRWDTRDGSGDGGNARSHQGDDSVGDIVRRALGFDGGDGHNASSPWQRPDRRWGNGRQGQGESEPTSTGTSPTREPTKTPTSPCPPTTKPTDPTTKPTKPSEPPGEPEPTPPQSFPGGGGGGAIVDLPRYKPPQVPDMQLPGELQPAPPGLPGAPAVVDAGAGVAAAAAPAGPAVPIALPVIVAPPLGLGLGGGVGSGGGGVSAGLPPAAPRGVPSQPPAGRNPQPANVGPNAAAQNASYRIGYNEYLRTAGLPQLAALAVPGLVGILVLTGAGGLVGYRQAKAGHAVHVGGSARFMR
jgi:hypothetical protein